MPEFAVAFRKHFPDLGPSNRFLDRILSAATRQPHLDVITLDDELHHKHGAAYPEDGMSTAEFVEKQYGAAAVAWVRAAV